MTPTETEEINVLRKESVRLREGLRIAQAAFDEIARDCWNREKFGTIARAAERASDACASMCR